MDKKGNHTTRPAGARATITFAINEDIIKEIKKEAEFEGITLSAKVTAILTRHIVLYRFGKDVKSIIVNGRTFQTIIEQIDENILSEDFTNNAIDYISTFFRAKNIPFTLENLIKYSFEGPGLRGGIYRHFHRYRDNSGLLTLVFRHNFGIKWSRVLSKGLSYQIKVMLNTNTTSEVLPSSVVIKILDNPT
jgi:hypothetical protein